MKKAHHCIQNPENQWIKRFNNPLGMSLAIVFDTAEFLDFFCKLLIVF